MNPETEVRTEDTLQHTLNKVLALKPRDSIQQLFDALLPVAKKMVGRRPRDLSIKKPGIYLLVSGYLWLHRKQDGLELCMAKAPHIFGLAEMTLPFGDCTWVRFSAKSEVYFISREKALAIFNHTPRLWQDVSKVIAFHLHFSTWRDLHLINGNAYDTIRGKLLELEKHSEDYRAQHSMLNYIQDTTPLSRSTVQRIIRDLLSGGYLEARRGKLLRIARRLPPRY